MKLNWLHSFMLDYYSKGNENTEQTAAREQTEN